MSDNTFTVTMKVLGDISDAQSNISNLQKSFSKVKLPDKLGDNLNKKITEFYKEYERYQKKIGEGLKTQGDYNQVEKSLNRMNALYKEIGNEAKKATKLDMKDLVNLDVGEFKKIGDEISNVVEKINKVKIDPSMIGKQMDALRGSLKGKKFSADGGLLDQLIGNIKGGKFQEAKAVCKELQVEAQKIMPKTGANGEFLSGMVGKLNPANAQAVTTAFRELGAAFAMADSQIDPLNQEYDELIHELERLKQAAGNDVLKNVNDYNKHAKDIDSVTDSLKRMHEEEFNFNRQAMDIGRQIQNYFGLSQMIRKVGDIARDAFTTVKELDAAMTETAVVTNFSVGDMWDMLPTYTAQANQLGSTIKDVYEAATLYYQQGLNTNQAMGLANETLKMARIAGLDAAEATDMMTAALRGFNMEINQASAQKINDVYSELAAITASDTAEIGSAMERTASIANSANMEFETTSAFLAQMIETTREAPENLGTAMKTIVARFQEMKQDPTKLVDSEGVAMDANKVDAALKSIGVNLMNTKGEFRDLDDVFLDISSRWDSLTQGQQRYIATIAAGSRQQSRFIAMMSDYERTMELVEAANNSAGASQRQFEKTLESMDTKLNKLKNAWDQFTMGLMNNQILKFGVDALTKGFTIINKFIDAIGKITPKPFEGITKSILTLVTTLGMLKLGGKGAMGITTGLFGWAEGTGFSRGFKKGWGTAGSAKQGGKGSEAASEQQGIRDGQAYQRGYQKGLSKFTSNFRDTSLGFGKALMGDLKQISGISKTKFGIFKNLVPGAAELTPALQDELEYALKQIDLGKVKGSKADLARYISSTTGLDQKNIEEADFWKYLKQGQKGPEQLAQGFGKLGPTISNAGSALSQFGMILQGTPFAAFGSTLMIIGNSLSAFGGLLGSTRKAIVEQYTAIYADISAKMADTAATTALGVAQGGAALKAKALGIAMWESLGPYMLIAVAIAALVGAYKLLDKLIVTNKEKMETATDAAAAASEAYSSAKQETSELTDAISKIQENDAAFDNLVAGTAEFNDQLVTANEQIMALIDKYPMLMEGNYVTTDKNGLMHISDEGLQKLKEYQKQIQANASAMNLIQTADLNALEHEQEAKELRKVRGAMSQEEHERNLRDADLLEQRAKAEVELARSNAIRTALNGKELRDVDALTSIYTNLYDTKRKAAEVDVKSMDKHDIRQQYANYHGYTYNKSTKKITDVEGNEVDYDDEAIKDEVIEQTVLLDFEANASSLEATLSQVDRRFSATLKNTSDTSKHFISDVLANNIEADEDLLEQALKGNDFQNVVNSMSEKEMATILGISAESIDSTNIDAKRDEIVSLLTDNATKIAEAQSDSYSELGKMLAQTKGWDTFTASQKASQETIQKEISDLTSTQAHTMSRFGQQLKESAGADTMQNYIGFMKDLYTEINETQFGNIDLNNREIQKNLDGTISTIMGGSGTYGKQEIPIAFSPMLQTGTGTPVQLDQSTVNDYLSAVVDAAGVNATAEDILKIDANPEDYGLDVDKFKADGHQIKGLIADVGDTAEATGEKMHAIEMDKEAAAEIESIFEGADLTSASARLETFTKLSHSSIDTVKALGDSLLSSSESANLLGETFAEFAEGDWLELSDNIDDFQNSLGQIDGAGILKAAEQSHSLNTLLEYGDVSATGLAMALQGVEEGKYAIEAVNTSVLRLLSSMTGLADAALEAHNIVENFDPGIDTGEGEDFVKDNAEKAKEYYDNGEYGNEQLQNYIKLAAGQDRWNEALKESKGNLKEAEESLIGYVTTFENGFQPAWDQMFSGQGINGKSLTENIEASDIEDDLKEKFKQVKFSDANGLMDIDIGDLTTKELEKYIKEAYDVSEDYAKLFMQDLANYDVEMGATLAKNDLKAAVASEDFKQANTDVNGNLVISDATLETFEAAGGNLEELAAAADTDVESLTEHSFKLLENGERRDDYVNLLQDYAKTFKTGKGSIQSLFGDESLQTEGKLDLSKLIKDTQAHGFDQEQAMQAAWAAYQRGEQLHETTSYEGVDLKSGIATYEEFTASIESALETSKWEAIGEAIAQGIINFIKGEDKDNNTTGSKGKKNKEETTDDTSGSKKAPLQKPAGVSHEEWARADEKTKEKYVNGAGAGTQDKNGFKYDPYLTAVEDTGPSRDLTWKDKLPGWLVSAIESTEKERQAREETNKETTGQTREELHADSAFQKMQEAAEAQIEANKEATGQTREELHADSIWSKIFDEGEKAAAAQAQKNGANTDATNQSSTTSDKSTDNLENGSQSLVDATTQFTTGVESLNTAGDSLKTAGDNLTKAATSITESNKPKPVETGGGIVAGIAQGAVQETTNNTDSKFTVDKTEAIESLDEIKAKAEETKKVIEQKTTFNIDVSGGINKLTKAADAAKKISDNSGTKSINVSATASGTDDTNKLSAAVRGFNKLDNHSVKLKTTLSGASSSEIYTAIAAIDLFHLKRDHTVTLKTIKQTVHDGEANGVHNHGYVSAPPSVGSAARGSYGQLGPKGKGGLTLTGELGYEIAWLPSENRSMILGANGPQMVNLPGDAVVWTHEQSKQILKQKAIPAGSHAVTGRPVPSTPSTPNNPRNPSNNTTTTTKGNDTPKPNTKVAKNTGVVLVWWENMARRVDAVQKKYDESAKTLEKRLKTVGTTLNSIKNLTNDYRKNLNQSIALNTQEKKQAEQELKLLKQGNNWRSKQEISYSVKKIEDGEEKSESKKLDVDLAKFLTYNSQFDTWEISQAALNKTANKSLKEAIKQALEKEINDRNSKIKTAEDNIKKAQEALDKLADDVYETFYRWEKSINKIYLLSQRLETLGKQQTLQTNVAEIEYAKMSIGIQTAAEAQEKVNKALREQNELLAQEVHGRNQAIVEARQEFDNALNFKTYEDIYKANKNSSTAQGDFEAAKMAFNLLSKAGLDSIDTFDYSKALAQLNSQKYNKETYDAIKQVLDKIFEKQNNLNDSVANAQSTVLKVYQQLEEYQTTIADFEESLLKGMEEEAEKQIDKLDKINNTLTKAYKELIDEVKAKLDERRKQEDNQKTESELSRKQQRLSMLRADTSGGHAVEIAQLEKEIADAQQNYQRSLEDQLIEKLQQQGDKAEQQRQKQIDLLNIQKNIAKETGTNLAEVKELLKDPTSNKAGIKKAWLTAQGYDNTTAENQKKLENDFEVAWAKYIAAWTQKNELMLDEELIGTFKDIGKYDDAIYKKLDTGIINVKLTDAQKKQVGWTATDFAKEGKNFSQLRALGYTYKGSVQAIAATKGLSYVIDQLGASANALIKDGGYTLAQVQKAYNNSDTKKTNKNYMQNAQAVLTKNNKNVATGTLQSNNWAYARSGSTLYAQKWDADKAQWEKDAAQYSIGAISAQQISSFGNLGKQALLDAIQTTPFGNIINKNFASLVKATGLTGKEVNLANGWTGSIGSDGLIYQNHATGVKKWNPSTGKITEDLYNDKKKAAFLAVAKRNSETSREYAQVLMNNKVYTKAQLQAMGVKFKTGGLANFTGPAWLDGTPSKPELVLNATDTKNFIALKDVLSKAIGSTRAISNEYGGDTTFEININVDHIANDYDVDKMAERVKKIIVKDSSYRNVTQVRKFR